jgi:hypothetical protein
VEKEAVDDAAIEMQLKNRTILVDQREGIMVNEALVCCCVVQMDFVIPYNQPERGKGEVDCETNM